MAEDPYLYPGTGVLRNSLEIGDSGELSQAEADIVGLGEILDRPGP
jgi:fido (protein-threonine AMPylation protein)